MAKATAAPQKASAPCSAPRVTQPPHLRFADKNKPVHESAEVPKKNVVDQGPPEIDIDLDLEHQPGAHSGPPPPKDELPSSAGEPKSSKSDSEQAGAHSGPPSFKAGLSSSAGVPNSTEAKSSKRSRGLYPNKKPEDRTEREHWMHEAHYLYVFTSLDDLKAHHSEVEDMSIVVPKHEKDTDEGDGQECKADGEPEMETVELMKLTDFKKSRAPKRTLLRALISTQARNFNNIEEGYKLKLSTSIGNLAAGETTKTSARYIALTVRYVKMWQSPSIRLLAAFHDGYKGGIEKPGVPFHVAYIDFPFNSQGGSRGVNDIKVTTHLPPDVGTSPDTPPASQTIAFVAKRAPSSGLFPNTDIEARIRGKEGDTDLLSGLHLLQRLCDASEKNAIEVVMEFLLHRPVMPDDGRVRVPEYPISPVWLAIQHQSPGGCGIPEYGAPPFIWPSTQHEFDFFFWRNANTGDFNLKAYQRVPARLAMNSKSPAPMVPLPAEYTFHDTDGYCVEMGTYIHEARQEERVATEGFNRGKHTAVIYGLHNKIVVVGVKFDPDYHKLHRTKAGDFLQYRVTGYERVQLKWVNESGAQRGEHKFKGYIAPFAIPGIPRADLYIIGLNIKPIDLVGQITPVSDIRLSKAGTADIQKRTYISPQITLRKSDSQYKMLIDVVNDAVEHAPLRPFLLGQNLTNLPLLDILTHLTDPNDGESSAHVQKIFTELLEQTVSWNAEQRQVLKALRAAPGGFVMVTGFAGTGKTTLLVEIARLMHQLGYHILSLGPTNNAVDMLAMALHDRYPDLSVRRVYPTARDLSPRHNFEAPKQPFWAGEVQENETAEFAAFNAVVAAGVDLYTENTQARHLGLQQAVIETAKRGDHELLIKFDGDDATETNMWAHLKGCIEQMEGGTFSLDDEKTTKQYKDAYRHCKHHMIAESRVCATTLGNVRTEDLLEYFAQDADKIAHHFKGAKLPIPKVKGIFVIQDEAFKAFEPVALSPLVASDYKDKIAGTVMVGDVQQLGIINTASEAFNPFHGRGDISFPARCAKNGFPVIELREQNRFPKAIAHFINQRFYKGRLRTSKQMSDVKMEDQWPGLYEVILDTFFAYSKKFRPYTSEQLRQTWAEFPGEERKTSSTMSKVVPEFAPAFFNLAWRGFHELCLKTKSSMRKRFAVILAHRATLNWWHITKEKFKAAYNRGKPKNECLTDDDFPELVSGDGSQGREWDFVVLDCAITEGRALGFMTHDPRVLVYLTRAKIAMMIIGGTCDSDKLDGSLFSPAPSLAVYREYLGSPEAPGAVMTSKYCPYIPLNEELEN